MVLGPTSSRSARLAGLILALTVVAVGGAPTVTPPSAEAAPPQVYRSIIAGFESRPDACIVRFAGIFAHSESPPGSDPVPGMTVSLFAYEYDSCSEGPPPFRLELAGNLFGSAFAVSGNARTGTLEATGFLLDLVSQESLPISVRLQFTATDAVDPNTGPAFFTRSGTAVGSITIDGIEYAPQPDGSASASRGLVTGTS